MTADDRQAWDMFAAAALTGVMPNQGTQVDKAHDAARAADELLRLRRERHQAALSTASE